MTLLRAFWKDPTDKHALILSQVSLALSALLASFGIALFVGTRSLLCLILGLENGINVFSSLIVVWRFDGSTSTSTTSDEEEDENEHNGLLHTREKRASVAISFILIVMGSGIISIAILCLVQGEQENLAQLSLLMALAVLSIVILSTLGVFKCHYASALESACLYKDAFCTLIAVLLAGDLFLNTLFMEEKPELWILDPMVALLAGITAFLLGMDAMVMAYHNDLPILSLRWWMLSQGDGKDEVNGREMEATDYCFREKGDNREEGSSKMMMTRTPTFPMEMEVLEMSEH